ncbi:hypothetical protein GUITHDRAFT_116344 [Guillardia theta CCMP2712]|uniref:SET domain-containing protein n=1 Tax=Guillardia theta (strain CCMP2712) TaxID=905079 RepID=L1IMP8_GUITC|nr:hypothetical protein GUITHDRAFT_116344 [Guillardia theta CCMP2712]EKX37536.1 hypothetical protein GUITHDRAFT_116344 [Guillardia theta CCMP2712]|eukprot:XP_005824516.1 hypothetical protein GUITHDRAFT_116344 [Guillardia theta CCMP2712]
MSQIRWEDPDGFDPVITLRAARVRSIGSGKPQKPRRRRTTFESNRSESRVQNAIFLPTKSSSGRKVNRIQKFSFSEAYQSSSLPPVMKKPKPIEEEIAGKWVGESLGFNGYRKYYRSVELASNGEIIECGKCVAMRPPQSSRSKWDASKPWIAAVKDLFEDTYGNMMMNCVWFYRPYDCKGVQLPEDTLSTEIFLSGVADENSIFSIQGSCEVRGPQDFELYKQKQALKVSESEEIVSDKEPLVLLCRRRFEEDSFEIVDIKDTQREIERAVNGVHYLQKSVMQHIRNFQQEWIEILMKNQINSKISPEILQFLKSRNPGFEATLNLAFHEQVRKSQTRSFYAEEIVFEESDVHFHDRNYADGFVGFPNREFFNSKFQKLPSQSHRKENYDRCQNDSSFQNAKKRSSDQIIDTTRLSHKLKKARPSEAEVLENKHVRTFQSEGGHSDDTTASQQSTPLIESRQDGNTPDQFPRCADRSFENNHNEEEFDEASQNGSSDMDADSSSDSDGWSSSDCLETDRRVFLSDINPHLYTRPKTVKGGTEWYPKLTPEEAKTRAGYPCLWVCAYPMCGQAFASRHFCKAHQLSAKHGKWEGENPMISKSGKQTAIVVDCTRSGEVTFASPTIEKKMRKLVKQMSGSEEPQIDMNLPVPGKVLHTGDRCKGWGLFACKHVQKGEFIGHYSGVVTDIGYAKRYTGHYTFGVIHGLAIDGTAGGALRFINHCMENEEPTARALIVNHHGVCHVAVYAAQEIQVGEEITLRYLDVSDAEFFASPCGLD